MKGVAAVTIAVGLVVARWGAASADPSAAEIVARNASARGGLDGWRKVETMVWIGHLESTHAPVPSMQFKLEQKQPNKMRLQILALGDRSVRVFDGVQGWKVRPGRARSEVQPFTPAELRFAQAGHGIGGPLIDHAAKGNSVRLEGVDEIRGRKAYHLGVLLAKGGKEDVWVDAETYLDVRYDRVADGPGGAPRRVSALYGDYRTVDGLKIPFLIQTGGEQGAAPDKMQIETVVLNAPLDDATFVNPAALRAHPRAWPTASPRAPASATASTAATAARKLRGAAGP